MAKTTKDVASNLALWDRVKETNPKFTKKVELGKFKFTTINAQYQKKCATEEFGKYGEAWGLKSTSYEYLQNLPPNNETLAICHAVFFYPGGEFPITSAIGVVVYNSKFKNHRMDDEFAKKVETDIITKALSHLGFNADIFLGEWDDNKYVNSITKKFEQKEAAANPPAPPQLKEKIAPGTFKNMMDAINSGDEGRIGKVRTYLDGVADIPEKKELLAELNK